LALDDLAPIERFSSAARPKRGAVLHTGVI